MSTSIAEGNKIIAGFMGAKTDSYNKWFYESRINDVYFLGHSPEEFRYHTSWDWLMPVVEKMSEHGVWTLRPDYACFENYKGELRKERQFNFKSSQMDWEREDDEPVEWIFIVHHVVVQYLTWYTSLTPINKP